jgi:hypothetical protein
VQRQYLDVEFDGSEAAALALQGRLSACARSLLPVIEQALDRYSPAQGVLRIDRLDVDAGCISLARIEDELAALVGRCLDGALRAQLANGPGPQRRQAEVLHAATALVLDEALAYFLQNGTLPASLHLAAGMDFESTVLAGWREHKPPAGAGPDARDVPTPCAAELVAALRSASAFRRLEGQFSQAFHRVLLARLAPALAAVLEQSLQHVDSDGGGTTAGPARNLLCSCALELAVHGAAERDNGPVHGALWRASPQQAARAAMEASQAPAPSRPTRAGQSHAAPAADAAPAAPAAPVTAQAGAPDAPGARLPHAHGHASHPGQEQGIYIGNAGLVLLHPFLPRLFDALGVSGDGRLVQPGRALALLHFLASGQPQAPEYELALPKLLCQLPLTANVDAGIVLDAAACDEAHALLAAVIGHWTALRDTSPDGLRGAFLLRPGKLSMRAGEWLLQVETQGVDVLLGELPWGISAIRLPWMERILWVEWA